MGKSLQKAIVVSFVALAATTPAAFSQEKQRTPAERCDLTCADMVFMITNAAAANPSGLPKTSPQQLINDLSTFLQSCKNLCSGGVFTVEALMTTMGFSGAPSYTSAPAANAAPAPTPSAPPPPPPSVSTNRGNRSKRANSF